MVRATHSAFARPCRSRASTGRRTPIEQGEFRVLNQLRSTEEDQKNVLEQGFTLVELLIVIIILGILAGIVVFAVGNLTNNAGTNACSTEADTFATAFQAYKTQATPAQWTTFTTQADVNAQGVYLRDTVSPSLLTFSGAKMKYLSSAAGQNGLATANPSWTGNLTTGQVTKNC